MQKHRWLAIVLTVLAQLWIHPFPARAQDKAIDAAQRSFIQAYVTAMRSQDLAKLKTLIHPAVLACINDRNRNYFDFIFAHDLKLGTGFKTEYQVKNITALHGAPALLGFYP